MVKKLALKSQRVPGETPHSVLRAIGGAISGPALAAVAAHLNVRSPAKERNTKMLHAYYEVYYVENQEYVT
jgi:hypothetical protein